MFVKSCREVPRSSKIVFCRGAEKCSKTVPRRLPGAIFQQNPVGEPFGGLLGAHENDKNTTKIITKANKTNKKLNNSKNRNGDRKGTPTNKPHDRQEGKASSWPILGHLVRLI